MSPEEPDVLLDAILRDNLDNFLPPEPTKLSVVEYARHRKMQPQLIYYYIRVGKLKEEDCICGRKVLDVATVDKFFTERDAKKRRDKA
jgi:hypothetical protein